MSSYPPTSHATPPTEMGLYRVIWRWHFYAGVLVGPLLMVVAVTGAIYVFKEELEHVIYPDTMFVTPRDEMIALDRQVAAVEEAYPEWRVDTVEIDADPTRATSVRIRSQTSSVRVYVNPHTGAVQGEIGEGSFFRVVLAIHRQLFVGTTGRVVVEVATCWTIVLLVTGLYLWFPRRREKLWGVLLPRLSARPYTVLRDLHAITGAFLMPIALTIAATGLIYSLVWGSGYRYATEATGGTIEPHRSVSPASSARLPLDEALAIVRARYPDASFIDIQLPGGRHTAFVARAQFGKGMGPRNRATLTLDRSTGAVIAVTTSDQLPALNWWRATWNYPLHVGSVLGTPTKVIWLIVCLVLAALPITGLCMWWQRRPDGDTGFPRRLDRPVPWWLIAAILLLGTLLPAVGATILLILAGEWVARRACARRTSASQSQPV